MIFRSGKRDFTVFLLSVTTFALCAALLWLPAWQNLERRGFDILSVATAPGTTPLPIFLIAIDDASVAKVPHPWPWPRSVHARLIDKLKDAGAAVIAFDVQFSMPGNPEENKALARSIARAGNVVLAASMTQQATAAGTLWARQEPLPIFLEAGAQMGLVNLPHDGDMVLRALPADAEAFWRRILVRLRLAMPEEELPGVVPEDGMIRYVGPSGSFPSLPYHLALELEQHVNPEELQGAVVIIGRATRAATDIGLAQGDLFATPFTFLSGALSPGPEIHANVLDSVIRQQSIRPMPLTGQLALLAALTLSGSLVLGLRRRWLAFGSVSVLIGGLLAASLALFAFVHWWLPVGAPILLLLLLGGGRYVKSALATRRERDQVRKMFALYVPPDVVKSLVAHPELAGLGGDTRHLTVLFCDLRGFTTLSSQLSPADITAVLNRYFTCMTDAIFAHGGTVDKFIGDAVMAFWGAPLPDAEQERHAVLAAQAMKDGLAELNTELAAQGKPPLRLGIGIHSGDALVGNMGAASRLSYTAIGDTVNVASRLEGANKTLGTEIMLSGETARAAPDLVLRPLGAIRVKGRPEPLDVLTPCDQPQLVEATGAALAAQRLGEYATAISLWQKVLALAPGDALATLALERLAAGAWDGVLDTDK